MSYANIASKGPKQSAEECFTSYKLLAIHHILPYRNSSHFSDFETDSFDRRAPSLPQVEPTESSTQSLVDVDSPHVSSVPSDYGSQSVKTDTQAERIEREAEAAQNEAERKARRAEIQARDATEKAKGKAKHAGQSARENADDPAVMANAIILAALSATLGWGAYRKYITGELTWKVAGAWTGVVGLLAAGDYFVTQRFLKQKSSK